MNHRLLRDIVLSTCMIAATGLLISAQAQGPGGPPHGGPPGGAGPGGFGPGGPGNMGGANNVPRPGSRSDSGAARSSQQFGPVGRWWDDKSVVKSIGLRKDQQKKMDTIFDSNRQAILDSYHSFLSEQAKLDKLNKDPKSDQASIFAAIDSVSKARAALQKTTAQMLLQIRQEMNSEQITKLEKLP
jgi:Spy/CpxP family protein refolding chaperone